MVTTRQILLCSPPTHAQFPQAIGHYEAAIGLDPTEITFRSNLAAVHFETKNYEKCVKVCEKAVEVGRENRADFKLIAKAWARYQDFLFKDRSVVFE